MIKKTIYFIFLIKNTIELNLIKLLEESNISNV